MKNFIKLFCFGVLTSFYGCLPEMGEWDITLYEQKIEGTSKAIYKYDAWGGRDSHKAGFAILDTTDTFRIPVEKNIFLDYLIEIPTKNLIEVAVIDNIPYEEMKKMKEIYIPIKLEEKEILGMKIKTKHYQEKGYRRLNGGGLHYKFLDFRETKDSICFYDLDYVTHKIKSNHKDSVKLKKEQDINEQIIDNEIKKFIRSELVNDSLLLYKFSNFKETKDSICFYDLNYHIAMKQFWHRDSIKEKKGHVIIRQGANKQIIEIIIKQLLFSELANDSLILSRWDVFKPKLIIKSTEFSDYGIFKEKIKLPFKDSCQ